MPSGPSLLQLKEKEGPLHRLGLGRAEPPRSQEGEIPRFQGREGLPEGEDYALPGPEIVDLRPRHGPQGPLHERQGRPQSRIGREGELERDFPGAVSPGSDEPMLHGQGEDGPAATPVEVPGDGLDGGPGLHRQADRLGVRVPLDPAGMFVHQVPVPGSGDPVAFAQVSLMCIEGLLPTVSRAGIKRP